MRHSPYTLLCAVLIIASAGCAKRVPNSLNGKHIASYSNEILDKWMVLQVRLMKNTVGVTNVLFTRPYAYSGIVAYESISQGMDDDKWLTIHWNGLSGLPRADEGRSYSWPQTLNAAMAAINHKFFPKASPVDSTAIDSLESALRNSFAGSHEIIQRSSAFGVSIADAIFNWAETDGYKHASDPYVAPVGIGLWIPTPPAFAPASTPYWGNLRTAIAGSTDNTQPGPPPFPYSTDPNSDFFKMVLQVYNASVNMSTEHMNMALWWRDIPGVTSPGHWLNILHQVLQQTDCRLGQAALAYALSGASIYDASISCWKTKYTYNQVRPVTYIRAVMGYPTWNSLLITPAHPEYSSAHAVISSATAEAITNIFGDIGSITDHTYDYLGWAPRTFPSIKAIGVDAGNSRIYAGLHYQPSIDRGLIQGTKVADNIFGLILFKDIPKSDY